MMAVWLVAALALMVATMPVTPSSVSDNEPPCDPETLNCTEGFVVENCTCVQAPLDVQKRSTSDCPEVTCPYGQIRKNCTCIQSPDADDSRSKRSVPDHTVSHTATDCIQKGITCLQEGFSCLEHGCKDCLVKTLSCTLESAKCMISLLNFHHGLGCTAPYSRKTRSITPSGTHECRNYRHRCGSGTCKCILQRNGLRNCRCTGCCYRHGRGYCSYICVPKYGGNCICTGQKCLCF
ncbi:uncharacterized protein LOC143025265 [Oratosquilla oratoria]|uniref:uncharacterized protein LOC143025265 n=1 Tax=Oratosquilla oratoria TaxID=337810 RepID=UPI003F7763BD